MENGQETVPERALASRVSKKELRRWMADNAPAFRELMAYYRGALARTESEVRLAAEELALRRGESPVEALRAAVKQPEEIVGRLMGGGARLSAEALAREMDDLALLRVTCLSTEELAALADALAKRAEVRVLRREDRLREAEDDGFRVLRLVVSVPTALGGRAREMKVTVELLTPAMELWLRMKERAGRGKPPVPGQADEALRACAELCAELDERFRQIQYNIEHNVITK